MLEVIAEHEKHIEELEAWKSNAAESSKERDEQVNDLERELRSVGQDKIELEKRLAKSESDRSSLCKMFQEESEAQKGLVMQLQERLETTEGTLAKQHELVQQLRNDLQESELASKRVSKENENARSDFDRLEARLEEMTIAAEKAKVALADAEVENVGASILIFLPVILYVHSHFTYMHIRTAISCADRPAFPRRRTVS